MRTFLSALALTATLPLAAQQSKIVKGNTEFAFDLYHKLSAGSNTFFSPYSVSAALGMTYAGARNKTADEMQKTLHINDAASFHKDFGQLIKDINSLNGTDVKMSIANRLFGEKKYEFLQKYLDEVKEWYSAPIERLNFRQEPDASRVHINKWVEDQTNDKIKDLIPPGLIKPITRLVLVNAIYFYGDWASQFKKENTKKGDFYQTDTKKISADLMTQQAGFSYFETSDFKAIRIPYKGHKVSMEIYLPNKKDGLAEWEKELTADNYTKWSGMFKHHEVNLTMPKFKMTYTSTMSDLLKSLGMELPFDERFADFTGMTEKRELYISEVVHKAFIDVSEKGTEAAAATAVIMNETTSVRHEPKPLKIFKADHPFFYVIRDNKSGSILFMGRMTDPTKA